MNPENIYSLDLPVFGEIAELNPDSCNVPNVASIIEVSAEWLKLPWVQERLEERWAKVRLTNREPFIL